MRFLLLLLPISCSATNLIGKFPIAFEAHKGEYVSRGEGYSLTVTPAASRLQIGPSSSLEIRVIGANPVGVLEGMDRMPARASYFRGKNLRESFELYSSVRRNGIYAGIDLIFRGNQNELEYDFVLAPGRNPSRIALAFEGATHIRIDSNGDLILGAGVAELRQPKPEAFQTINGMRRPVNVAYRLDGSRHVRFRIGHWNRRYSLVIDPQVVFNSSFGGSASSHGEGIALDTLGNIYVAGQTNSADFPSQNAAQSRPGAAPLLASVDGGQSWAAPPVGAASSVRWIAAAPGQPSLLYATSGRAVLKSIDGGNSWTATANSGLTAALAAIAVDAGDASRLYAASFNQGVFISTDGGASWSATTNGLFPSNSNVPAQLQSIVAHPSKPGTVYAIASTPSLVYRSADFGQSWTSLDVQIPNQVGNSPIALAVSPADPDTLFLAEQDQQGAFLKSTDGGDTWAILSTGNKVQTTQGLAISPDNPFILYAVNTQGLQRSSDGGHTWTTVLQSGPGSVSVDPRNSETVYALDRSGLYRSSDAGQTWTKMTLPAIVPVSLFVSPADSRVFIGGGSQTDAFITKWSPDGGQLLYSTYLGGNGMEDLTGLAVDNTGSAYVTGYTFSQDFPITANAFQKTLAGNADGFVSKLSPDGSQLLYSTLLGTGTILTGRIAVDRNGSAIVTGATGNSYQLTTACNTNPSFSVATTGSAFVIKIAPDGGSTVYSSQINGSCWTGGQSVAVDAKGNVWVAGQTTSSDLPVTPDALQSNFGGGIYDGFLARLDSAGAVDYLTYLGGAGYDLVNDLTFDRSGNIYLTGSSGGFSQPASVGAYQAQSNAGCSIVFVGPPGFSAQGNAFVLKLDSAAHAVLGLTYLGAPFCLFATTIAVDATEAPWIAGDLSQYGSAPQTASPFQIGIGTSFISKFSPDLSQLLFSTYFDPVFGLVLDSSGMAYVTGGGPYNFVLSTQSAYVAKIDPIQPAISLDSVMPAVTSSYLSSNVAIAPGEVLRIFGRKMGPDVTTPGVIDSGVLASSVAGVQVTFDGIPAPLLSISAQEIDLVTPFELTGKSATTVQVRYNGVKSNPVQIAVTGMAVEILALLNEDFTFNSASNPAKPGSVMTMYLSGAGQTNPPSQDGQINHAPFPAAAIPIQLEWFEIDPGRGVTLLPVTFAGAAPDLAAGILQVNFIAPQQSLSGVNLLVGGISAARLNVTIQSAAF